MATIIYPGANSVTAAHSEVSCVRHIKTSTTTLNLTLMVDGKPMWGHSMEPQGYAISLNDAEIDELIAAIKVARKRTML